MVSFAICAFDSKPATFIKEAFGDFFKAVPNLSESWIDDVAPFFHTFSYEYRKARVLYAMVTCHFM
ncbi:hypothetical protein D1647_18895 [Alistipes sp. Z76]|jgi:hypothetical protein|uniref:hypothetical protein n=1 Tax=Bacteroides acidifaciens TaxID=85831 RepID=UPI00137DE9D0|nr:hypothetical protein [Bacteroides acidifaciens]NBH93320.1 hypothetical protein [Muribaculaceae bacterium S4]NBI21621.1 hypothetical protein [Muribaculaceae bacterium Z1]NBJ08224.1 hypothetical protein [Alistipes sp. Z76]NCE70237.1 hypothetical protein [Muribaculaceae bacterium M3]